jgi:hypothetical protein
MWVDRIERQAGMFVGVTLSRDGIRSTVPVEKALALRVDVTRSHRTALNTDFLSWKKASTARYTNEFGYRLNVTENHAIYSFEADGTTVLIPALVLMRAIFAAPAILCDFLYRPQALDFLCTPIFEGSEVEIKIVPKSLTSAVRNRPAILPRLTWFHFFPSARKMWHSVYRSACDGTLSLSLPAARADLSLRGVKKNGTLYVTDASIWTVQPNEPAYSWVPAGVAQFCFDKRKTLGKATKRATRDDGIPRTRDGTFELSEVEWNAIKSTVRYREGLENPRLRCDPKIVLSGILEKLGTGRSWAETEIQWPSRDVLNNTYLYLKKTGRWENMLSALRAVREPAAAVGYPYQT